MLVRWHIQRRIWRKAGTNWHADCEHSSWWKGKHVELYVVIISPSSHEDIASRSFLIPLGEHRQVGRMLQGSRSLTWCGFACGTVVDSTAEDISTCYDYLGSTLVGRVLLCPGQPIASREYPEGIHVLDRYKMLRPCCICVSSRHAAASPKRDYTKWPRTCWSNHGEGCLDVSYVPRHPFSSQESGRSGE